MKFPGDYVITRINNVIQYTVTAISTDDVTQACVCSGIRLCTYKNTNAVYFGQYIFICYVCKIVLQLQKMWQKLNYKRIS